MQTFAVEIRGITPLLQHRMSEETLMGLLISEKGDKKKSRNPKTPRDIAEQHAYKDKEGFYIPLSYVSGAVIETSSDYKQKDSSRKSLKRVIGGAFRPTNMKAILFDNKWKPIKDFEVDIQRATNHLKGAVAVCRPRFDEWQTKFNVIINEHIVSRETALSILEDAGRRVGIGSFRVSKGGYFGQYEVTKWEPIS